MNEETESKWPLNAQCDRDITRMADTSHLYIYDIMKHCLGSFCIESPARSWLLADDVNVLRCAHSGDRWITNCFFQRSHFTHVDSFRKTSCNMMQDLISISRLLEEGLKSKVGFQNLMALEAIRDAFAIQILTHLKTDFIGRLGPMFGLVGSSVEGTRVGLGNELDVLVSFSLFEDNPFSVVLGDPFHIIPNAAIASNLSNVLDSNGCFNFDSFMERFLNAIEWVLGEIFAADKNPPQLGIVTSNQSGTPGGPLSALL